MSLNFQQVYEKIREIGLGAGARQEALESRHRQAADLLAAWADRKADLDRKLESALREDPSLRCAIPPKESFQAAHDPQPIPPGVTLIAADGSQIAPDRHAAALYSLVNVGAILLRTGSGEVPQVFTESRLLFEEELYTDTGVQTAEAVDLQRDIA